MRRKLHKIPLKRISLQEAKDLGLYQGETPSGLYRTQTRRVKAQIKTRGWIRNYYETVRVKKHHRGGGPGRRLKTIVVHGYSYKRLVKRVRIPGRVQTVFYEFPVPKDEEKWISLRSWIQFIKEKYGISRGHVEPIHKFLKWVHEPTKFFSWSRVYPPYRGQGFYVKLEIWYVIRNRKTDEYFIWDASRTRGIDTIGIEWDEIFPKRDELIQDTLKMIEKKDYLEFLGVIGWSVYPNADWYNNLLKTRRGQF